MRLPAYFAALLLLVLTAPAHADAMRCGNRLVSEGDGIATVRDLCGDPTDVQTRTIVRRPYYDRYGRYYYYGNGLVEVPVEIWTYNLGPYKLMRRVRFVDGVVDEIETLGYGYHAREPAASAPPRMDRETYR
jgi:Protein of unknown function (DUF2845)